MTCICDASTKHRRFVPAYTSTPFGTDVSGDFRARVGSIFGAYFGVPADLVEEALDDFLNHSADAGEEVSEALGDFLVMLVENDL